MTHEVSPQHAIFGHLGTRLSVEERIVLDIFNKFLPRGWEIYVHPHLNGVQPDFILLNPNVGIALFEVEECSWTDNSRLEEKIKFAQNVLNKIRLYKSVFGNFSFYSYKKACGQKKTVRGSKNSRRLSNGTPAI